MKLNESYGHIIVVMSIVLMANNIYAEKLDKVYKWIDEDGQVNYGNKSDAKNVQEIEIKHRYIDPENLKQPLSPEERVEKQKKSIVSGKKLKVAEEEKRIVRCNASKDQLKRAEDATALYDLEEKGSRILLNKKQYEQAMKLAKMRVKKWCNQ